MGATFILTGLYLIFLKTKKSGNCEIVEEKIIQYIILLTFIVFIISINLNPEILFIMAFLVILVIKEITDQFTSVYFKNRINVFIFSFFLLFIFIVIKRIINF